MNETFAKMMLQDLPKKLQQDVRAAASLFSVLSVGEATTDEDKFAAFARWFEVNHGQSLYAALRKAAVAREDDGQRPKPYSYNVEVSEADCLTKFKNESEAGALGALPLDFYSEEDGFYARNYKTAVDAEVYLRLRNDVAAATLCVNYLLVLCATLQRADHGCALLTPQPDHRYRKRNLQTRLRNALFSAKDMLGKALARGRAVRGKGKDEGKILNSFVIETAVTCVSESIASLQALYATNPDTSIAFKIRYDVPFFIEAVDFNDAPTRGQGRVYSRAVLGKQLRHGLVPAGGRVVLKLDAVFRRSIQLSYKPCVSHETATNVTTAAARKHQTARCPGGLHYAPNTADATGLAEYTVRKTAVPGTTRLSSWDPGVRTFHLGWDTSNGQCLATNGPETVAHMKSLLQLADGLKAKRKVTKAVDFRRYLRAQAQVLRTRLRNLVTNAHGQFAQFLVDRFDFVLLPKLGVGQMVQRYNEESDAACVLTAMTKRMMLAWRHGEFRSNALASKLRFHKDLCVIDVTEKYTSKGLSACFVAFLFVSLQNQLLTPSRIRAGCNFCFMCTEIGGSEMFKCASCPAVVPRDVNGAVGICIRSIVLAIRPELLGANATVIANAPQPAAQ